MIRAVLVDNERPLLDELEYLLSQHDEIEIIGTYTQPVKALEEIRRLSPDVVFLDVDMPILSGMNLAAELRNTHQKMAIVFVTAYEHYAVQAFEVAAIDYLIKPIRSSRLKQTVEKLVALSEKSDTDHSRIQPDIGSASSGANRVSVYDGEEYHVISPEEILYVEASRKDSILKTKHKNYVTRKPLEFWENELLDHGFIRCHRGFIVNMDYVAKLSPMFNNTYTISLHGDVTQIPVSRTHAQAIKTLLNIR